MERASSWPSLGAIAEKALDLESEHRGDFLDRTCGADTPLRQRVDSLLEADRKAGSFLAQPAAADLAGELVGGPVTSAYSKQRIGPYRIQRLLGAGGVGEVFLAARADDQYEQHVAIKVLRHRLGSDDAKRRILAERQILARLEHPNIARLYDGGATDDGRPYLVMEYVDGLPIDTFCARRRLTLEARLDLFAALCSAVQFAHQNFVVHRDLKPSNILVTRDATLKLLDFSIAKAIAPDRDLVANETATGSSPMTLAFASPEQIHSEPATAATDVHGLGIMLYRILTGRHPFITEGKAVHEVAEVVCSSEPIPPSRVSIDAEDAAPVADKGAPLPPRSLAGDLDAITLKALAKRPENRYPSAEQLAADLDRHRRRLPILARPPRPGYRLRKALFRHRAAILMAAAAGLLIVTFVLALVAQTRRANAEAARASAQAERASREAVSAEEVSDFLVRIISARPGAVTAEDMLARGRKLTHTYLQSQPESQGRILDSIAVAYERIGLYDTAAEVFAEALGIRSDVYGASSPEVAATLRNQARLLMTTGDYAAATRIVQQALAIDRAAPKQDPPAIAEGLHMLGALSQYQGRFHESESHSRAALRIRREHFGNLSSSFVATLNNLSLSLHSQGRYEEAEALLLETIAIREELQGPNHPAMAVALVNLAEFYSDQGRDEEAETFYLESLRINREAFGDGHPQLALNWLNVGSLYLGSDRLDQAEQALIEAQRIVDRAFDAEHPWTMDIARVTAQLRLAQGRLEEAEALARQAHAGAVAHLGDNHPLTAQCSEAWAQALARLGRTDEAHRQLAEAYGIHLSVHGSQQPETKKFCAENAAACRRGAA